MSEQPLERSRHGNALGLSWSVNRAPPAFDGVKGTPRSQKILRDAGHRRSEIGIVRAALDDRLLLDEDLVFPRSDGDAPRL